MSFILDAIRGYHRARLTNRLQRMGLTYHDAVAEIGVYNKAISRLPPAMQEARQRRIKRAIDLSQKHIELSPEQWEDPWREYDIVEGILAETQKEADERAHMTGQFWLPYHLGRETWFPYDTSKTWFWLSPPQGKGAKAIAGGYAAKQLK